MTKKQVRPARRLEAPPEDQPIVWFAQLLIALDKGDFSRALRAQRELARLGWCIAPPVNQLGKGAVK
jgi:hypothetical protein